jgi:hypothetical protein
MSSKDIHENRPTDQIEICSGGIFITYMRLDLSSLSAGGCFCQQLFYDLFYDVTDDNKKLASKDAFNAYQLSEVDEINSLTSVVPARPVGGRSPYSTLG